MIHQGFKDFELAVGKKFRRSRIATLKKTGNPKPLVRECYSEESIHIGKAKLKQGGNQSI